MPTLLTFGDSNTHGTPPIEKRGLYARYPVGVRWPTVCHAALGPDWTLIEEGLPGRTTCFADPVMGDHMNGEIGLKIALESHGPLDVLTLMLGTNDVKAQFGATPEAIMGGMARLLSIANSEVIQTRHGGFKTLVICPPPVLVQGPIADTFYTGDTKSRALPALYHDLAAHWGAGFLDAGQVISVSADDGVHYSAQSHQTLGASVAAAVTELF